MNREKWLDRSERLSRALLRLYPAHFREELGEELVEAYRDSARTALDRGGVPRLMRLWLRAVGDSIRNGLGERGRPSISWRRLGNWGRDSELVVRRLVRAPLFVATMVGTLTIGLGAFAVVYAVVDEVLIEPLPYENPDDLYFVWRDYRPMYDLSRGAIAGPDVVAMAAAGGPIEDAVALEEETATLAGESGEEPREVGLTITSPNFFGMLGAEPALGRLFAPSEVGPGRPPLAVVSHEIWRTRFGSDPTLVGRDVRLDGVLYEVIGVMGPDFGFQQSPDISSGPGADFYTTFDLDLAAADPFGGWYSGLIRARPGASPEEVASAVDAVGRVIDENVFEQQGVSLFPVGMKADLVSRVRPALIALGLAGLLLVLVLGVNLATLLLVRAGTREREFAISRALGANRGGIVRATLLEGVVLGLLSGVGAVLLAVWGTRAVVALAPLDLPRRDAVGVDFGTAAVVIGMGVLIGLLAGAVPATWSTRTSLATLLHAAAVRGGAAQGRMRRGMVVAQVALALVLLSTGGLVVRSFERLLSADPGFTAPGVLTLRIPVSEDRYPDAAAVNALHQRIETELAALPGVRAVGAVSGLPLTGEANQINSAFPAAPGNTGDPGHDQPLVDYFGTRPGYFEALDIPLLAGRGFSETPPAGVFEVLIDRTLAAEFYGDASPLGMMVELGGDSALIVGVVGHARQYDVHRDDRGQLYLRSEDAGEATLSWALLTERDPAALATEARRAIARVDPQLAVSDVRGMDELVNDSLRQYRVSALTISGFSLAALVLAAMGLYGIVAGSINRRRGEIAVRVALGAEKGGVVRLMVGEGMTLVLMGILVGVPGVWGAARLIESTLVGVSPSDPVALGGVAGGLLLVAVAACWIPARRAAALDPAGLLRQE